MGERERKQDKSHFWGKELVFFVKGSFLADLWKEKSVERKKEVEKAMRTQKGLFGKLLVEKETRELTISWVLSGFTKEGEKFCQRSAMKNIHSNRLNCNYKIARLKRNYNFRIIFL